MLFGLVCESKVWRMALLSNDQFKATMGDMRRIAGHDAPLVPMAEYRRAIDADDLGDWTFSGTPDQLYRREDGGSVHVLYGSDDKNVFLVVVVDVVCARSSVTVRSST